MVVKMKKEKEEWGQIEMRCAFHGRRKATAHVTLQQMRLKKGGLPYRTTMLCDECFKRMHRFLSWRGGE
jgi:hypothetical protein